MQRKLFVRRLAREEVQACAEQQPQKGGISAGFTGAEPQVESFLFDGRSIG
jgi:hypothetical protein